MLILFYKKSCQNHLRLEVGNFCQSYHSFDFCWGSQSLCHFLISTLAEFNISFQCSRADPKQLSPPNSRVPIIWNWRFLIKNISLISILHNFESQFQVLINCLIQFIHSKKASKFEKIMSFTFFRLEILIRFKIRVGCYVLVNLVTSSVIILH